MCLVVVVVGVVVVVVLSGVRGGRNGRRALDGTSLLIVLRAVFNVMNRVH